MFRAFTEGIYQVKTMFSFSKRAAFLALGTAALLATTAVDASTLSGHGGGHHGGATTSIMGEPGKASEVSRIVEITMHDNYYMPENLSVKPGETVRFVVKNVGSLVHEFNIGDATAHSAHQREMAAMMDSGALEPDRLNHEMMGHGGGHGQGAAMAHDDPNSVLLEPGKTGEVIWKFATPSALEFACNVPGHYDAGMMGQFRFQ